MEKRPTIYCSLDILIFISEMFTLAFKNEKAEDVFLWNNWYTLLVDKSQLFVDFDIEKITTLSATNHLIKTLIKGSNRQGQKSDITPMPNFFAENNFGNVYPPNSIFLLDKTEQECLTLSNQFGMIFLNKDTLASKSKLLFSWALYNVTKDTKAIQCFKNWKELQNFKHPFNAMIVVDNYILDEQKGIDNLKGILESYLPDKLENIDFHLTIITSHQVVNRKTNVKTNKYDLQNKYDNDLHSIVQSLNKSYKVNISLISIDSDKNHDRNIFTNYFWLHSGHSFDYFNSKGEVTNPTNLMIFPIFYQNEKMGNNQNSVYEAIYQHLSEIKGIVDNAKTNDITIANTQNTLPKNAIGNKQNRLLE